MSTRRRVTATLPRGSVRRTRAYRAAMALRGKIKVKIDLDESRERSRR